MPLAQQMWAGGGHQNNGSELLNIDLDCKQEPPGGWVNKGITHTHEFTGLSGNEYSFQI